MESLRTDKPLNKWITVKKYCEITGDSAKAIYVRRSKGVWVEGKHSKNVPGIGVMLNIEEINKWIESCQWELE